MNTAGAKPGVWMELRLVVDGDNVRLYFDNSHVYHSIASIQNKHGRVGYITWGGAVHFQKMELTQRGPMHRVFSCTGLTEHSACAHFRQLPSWFQVFVMWNMPGSSTCLVLRSLAWSVTLPPPSSADVTYPTRRFRCMLLGVACTSMASFQEWHVLAPFLNSQTLVYPCEITPLSL